MHVLDSGAGIACEDLPKLFSLFGKLHRTAEINNDGIGLGLTIVKQIVEAASGTISAESEGLDCGSCLLLFMRMDRDTGEGSTSLLANVARGSGTASSDPIVVQEQSQEAEISITSSSPLSAQDCGNPLARLSCPSNMMDLQPLFVNSIERLDALGTKIAVDTRLQLA